MNSKITHSTPFHTPSAPPALAPSPEPTTTVQKTMQYMDVSRPHIPPSPSEHTYRLAKTRIKYMGALALCKLDDTIKKLFCFAIILGSCTLTAVATIILPFYIIHLGLPSALAFIAGMLSFTALPVGIGVTCKLSDLASDALNVWHRKSKINPSNPPITIREKLDKIHQAYDFEGAKKALQSLLELDLSDESALRELLPTLPLSLMEDLGYISPSAARSLSQVVDAINRPSAMPEIKKLKHEILDIQTNLNLFSHYSPTPENAYALCKDLLTPLPHEERLLQRIDAVQEKLKKTSIQKEEAIHPSTRQLHARKAQRLRNVQRGLKHELAERLWERAGIATKHLQSQLKERQARLQEQEKLELGRVSNSWIPKLRSDMGRFLEGNHFTPPVA